MSFGAAAALFVLSACDQTFEPLGKNDAVFSMFAVLNASADTQWVRVMPVRESVFSEPAPIDAMVTLEHLETGHVTELRDSLFKYAGSDPDIVADLYVHNFWTTEPLVRGGTYTVLASRSDGRSAWATVRVPLSVRRVVVSIRQNRYLLEDFLSVESDGHLALLQVLHGEGRGVQRQGRGRLGTGAGGWQIPISRITVADIRPFGPPVPERPEICAQDRICAISMLVSGEEWPFKEAHSEAYVTQDDALSNVEEGTGFVGAVLAHEVPYESCLLSPATSTPCALVYDETTATVTGTVTDTTCNARLRGAWVVLRRADGTRFRTARTRADGSFSIGAVEAGIPHVIVVEELTNHASQEQTVPPLTGGETRELPLGVERVGPCP